MTIKTIDSNLSVGPQIAPEEVARLKAKGFRSVICNRPDGEEWGQPAFAEVEKAAKAAGMEARHIPVTGQPGPAQAAQFAAALKEMPGPVYAYCRSGGRAGMLAAMSGRPRR